MTTVTIQTPQQTADPTQMKHILAELTEYLKAHGITTAPSGAYPIRGTMNNIDRNHMPMEMLCGIIDKMRALKLNTYHFHCTENEEWRLESKLYPSLTEAKNMPRFPGKYYMLEEFRRFVEYCRVRNVMVIPEMDMPGHSTYLRRASGITSMNNPRMTRILTDIVKELHSLAPAKTIPT